MIKFSLSVNFVYPMLFITIVLRIVMNMKSVHIVFESNGEYILPICSKYYLVKLWIADIIDNVSLIQLAGISCLLATVRSINNNRQHSFKKIINKSEIHLSVLSRFFQKFSDFFFMAAANNGSK